MPGAMNSRYESCDLAGAAKHLQHACVVLRAVAGRDLRIAPAVILNQLAAAIDERLQIRIERIDGVVVRFLRPHDVGIEIELLDIPARVVEHDEPELVESGRSSRCGPSQVGPSQLAAGLEARDLPFGLRIHGGRVNQPRRLDLCRRQTRGPVGALALQDARIERAALRILDQAILHAVQGIARFNHRAGEGVDDVRL